MILGDTNQAGEDSRNVARNALLLAGLPVTVPGQTVNRLCASGLGAVIDSARAISCGEGELYIAGGVESMSRAPFVMGKAESAYSRDAKFMTPPLALAFQIKIIAQYGGHSMPETGDNVAAEFGISREQADLFAAQSQAKYQKAKEEGFFADEITPIEVFQGKNCHLNSFLKMNILAQVQLLKHSQS